MRHEYERLPTTYAYNIPGSYEDECDAAQDAYPGRMQQHKTVDNEKACGAHSVISIASNRKHKQ
ncbi:hypothetical protein I5907_07215 [Panacibacter sp. DH6]|uniref:Uncharacterized protein n=1 Tax=Panacibacter microcysteis TaxID=2793269 RepID=A0A931GYH4_9BACT|nr:hypothetical protein [Panacibacter microcysteis]MBG9376017.1 hypothetical protein [Panacibacter microcysteis]